MFREASDLTRFWILGGKRLFVFGDNSAIRLCSKLARHTLPLLMIVSIAHAEGNKPEVERVTCPDGYAIKIPTKRAFGGSWIMCEDFDEFHDLVEKKQWKRAQSLLLIEKKSGGTHDKLKPRGKASKREKEPMCDAVTE